MIDERFRKMAEEIEMRCAMMIKSDPRVKDIADALQSVSDENQAEIEIHKKESERLAWELEGLRIEKDDNIDALKQLHSENADAWNKEIERLKAEIEKLKSSIFKHLNGEYFVDFYSPGKGYLVNDKPAPSFCLECNQPFVGNLATICERCSSGMNLTGDAVKDNVDPS
jgi:hypothetical protein